MNIKTKLAADTNSIPKPVKKVYFFIPVPKLNEAQFKKITKGTKTTKYHGFNYGVDFDPELTWEKYKKDYDEVIGMANYHIETLKKSHQRGREPVEAEFIHFPEDETALQTLKDKIKKLRSTDEFYINIHGNDELIGLGPLEMNPEQLGDFLAAFLPNPPPTLLLWSCKSGVKNPKTQSSFADKLHQKLKITKDSDDELFQDIHVIGTTNLLIALPNTYVGAKTSKPHRYKPIEPEESLSLASSTPGTTINPKDFVFSEGRKKRKKPLTVYTPIREFSVYKKNISSERKIMPNFDEVGFVDDFSKLKIENETSPLNKNETNVDKTSKIVEQNKKIHENEATSPTNTPAKRSRIYEMGIYRRRAAKEVKKHTKVAIRNKKEKCYVVINKK